jgi:RES domain-containing protein
MRLWRMSVQTTLPDACRQEQAGRWHRAGATVLYLSQSPELAVLEARVHHRIGMDGYWIASVGIDDALRYRTLALDALPADWRTRKAFTRKLGMAWLDAGREPLLRVPSAVVPLSYNFLVNPDHPSLRGRLRLRLDTPMRFDRRLVMLL